MKKIKGYTKKVLGHIGVDTGNVWIGDPCYILHNKELPKSIGKDWSEFCNRLKNTYTSFNYDPGHEGLGICTQTLNGDGYYPVLGFFKENSSTPSYIVIDFENDYEI